MCGKVPLIIINTSYREWRRDWPDEARQPLDVRQSSWCQILKDCVFQDEREWVSPPSLDGRIFY